jgi:hypothetical protein
LAKPTNLRSATIARVLAAALAFLGASAPLLAQDTARESVPPAPEDTRTQYPAFLRNSYFSVNLGYIDYAFSGRQLEPGLQASSISVPHVAARIGVFGHEFGPYFAAQLTYMRPVRYVTYVDINGDNTAHHVFTHFGGMTLKARLPIANRVSIYGEGGLDITSRRGFSGTAGPVVRDAHYASFVGGAGLEYRVSPTVDLTGGVTFSPSSPADEEPHAILVSGGFRYTMRPLPPERVEANRRSGFIFPLNLLQLEYSTDVGYAINTFLSAKVPVFWGGNVKVDQGVAVHYERNVFHTAKVFALDIGASAASWRSRQDHDRFQTLSVYPLFRFTLLRTKPVDGYFCYSLAGPTYISKLVIDGLDTGDHFTFQDFLGGGVFIGKNRNINAGVTINHYSNGNIFTHNAGVKIPITLTIGYSF